MPPLPDRVPPRRSAQAEIETLIEEIPAWDDRLLLSMRQRFATSRLFRRRHDAEAPLTSGAQTLLAAVEREVAARGLASPSEADETEDEAGYWDLPHL